MSVHTPVEEYLTIIIDEYREVAKRIGHLAEQGSLLSVHDLNELAVSNARANAALHCQRAFEQASNLPTDVRKGNEGNRREQLTYLISEVQRRMELVLNADDAHSASFKVFHNVLNNLREMER